MGGSIIKNPRKLFSQAGGGGAYGTNVFKIAYFASVTAASGTITIPTGATVLLDEFAGGIDAYVSTIVNGEPTGNNPQTAASVEVDVTSFDASGNYTLSGTPSAFPVALIYMLSIQGNDWGNLTTENILVANGDLQRALDNRITYPIRLANEASFNPSDGSTFYFGTLETVGANASPNIRRYPIVATGVIKQAVLGIRVAGTLATNEATTLYIRINDTTDYQLTATLTHDIVNQVLTFPNLNIPVTFGDFLEGKIVYPTFATNPTNVLWNLFLIVEPT